MSCTPRGVANWKLVMSLLMVRAAAPASSTITVAPNPEILLILTTVPFEVVNRLLQEINAIAEEPHGTVALLAQETPHLPGLMAMVHRQREFLAGPAMRVRLSVTAHGTD